MRIGDDFRQFMDTGDKKFIKRYGVNEIRMALRKMPSYQHGKPWYKEMERRLESLERYKEKWFDRFIGFILGFISAILVGLILKIIDSRFLK